MRNIFIVFHINDIVKVDLPLSPVPSFSLSEPKPIIIRYGTATVELPRMTANNDIVSNYEGLAQCSELFASGGYREFTFSKKSIPNQL